MKESFRHTTIAKNLAIFIGATNVPFSLIDSEEFRDLHQEMNRKYQVPRRKGVSSEIIKIYNHYRKQFYRSAMP